MRVGAQHASAWLLHAEIDRDLLQGSHQELETVDATMNVLSALVTMATLSPNL